ncbi:MAG: FAD-dependent oxidoreductase [Labilithrix sp.]|nr:FAD-dependent oxidoreductase [Labilithrix sp.]
MPRTPLLRRLLETITNPHADEQALAHDRTIGRRSVLQGIGLAAATLATPRVLGACAAPVEGDDDPIAQTRASLRKINADVGIVGAGIAGLACAYELTRAGVKATIHEGNTRVGGRIWTMGGSFAGPVDWLGQVIERGGELIDNGHKTMIGYARELKLSLEDVTKPKRDAFYYFGGEKIPESRMVDEYRVLVDAMRADLRTINSPTADSFTPADQLLDRMSFAEWLERREAPPHIRALLSVAYTIEYGVPVDRMSALAFLLFAKASRQSKLRLFGNWSDERYHVIGGNQQIPVGLAAKLPGQLRFGRKLVAAKKLSDGRIELTFVEGGRTVTATHDAVVLTVPFHLLREVDFHASLAIPAWKKHAIQNTVYGDNAKLMLGFNGRPWIEQGGSGATYSDLPTLHTTWETNPALGNDARGVITHYTGAALARSQTNFQRDGGRFLDDFDRIIPGAKARARRDKSGKPIGHLEAWTSSPWTKGAYTANAPGYFTTIAGNEGKPIGNLYFAGETTDSFYDYQGFMEGGALSGLRAAGEISRDF